MSDKYENRTLMDAKSWASINDSEWAIGQRIDCYGINGDFTLEGTFKIRPMSGSDNLDIWLYASNWDAARDAAADLRAFAEELVMFANRYEDEARTNLAAKEVDID